MTFQKNDQNGQKTKKKILTYFSAKKKWKGRTGISFPLRCQFELFEIQMNAKLAAIRVNPQGTCWGTKVLYKGSISAIRYPVMVLIKLVLDLMSAKSYVPGNSWIHWGTRYSCYCPVFGFDIASELLLNLRLSFVILCQKHPYKKGFMPLTS